MADYRLTAQPPLGIDPLEINGVEAREVTDYSIVSLATPLDGEDTLIASVSSAYGVALPAIGRTVRSDDGSTLILGLQPGQFFVLFKSTDEQPLDLVNERIRDEAYLTDQSDSWAMVRISGTRSREALERICPIDLDPLVFVIGAVARTLMEHLGVIILREDEDAFLLMSARSSARSFWHALELSIRNIA